MLLCRTSHDGTAGHGIAAIGRVDGHMQEVAKNIDHNMVLMPFDFLAPVDPTFFARVLGLDALRVDDPVTWRGRARVSLAMKRIELIQCRFPKYRTKPPKPIGNLGISQ